MSESEIIRKSPIVIVRNLVAVQFAASGIYFLAGSLMYYAQIWRGWHLAEIIPFQIAQIIFVFAAETILIFYIFFMWWRQSIHISASQIKENHGVIFRKHVVVKRSHVSAAIFSQSMLGKLTHYGTIKLQDSKGNILMKLGSIPEPEKFVEHLMGRQHEQPPEDTADPSKLLLLDEHERLERKSTLRWDIGLNKVNKALERSAMKTVAAFLNGNGGDLIIGIGDNRQPIGLGHDYASLIRKDADGFINHFGNIFNAMIGPHLRHLVQLRPFTHEGKECMLVSVGPSSRPAFLKDDDKEEFFIRTGNATTSLKVSEAAAYIETRWDKK